MEKNKRYVYFDDKIMKYLEKWAYEYKKEKKDVIEWPIMRKLAIKLLIHFNITMFNRTKNIFPCYLIVEDYLDICYYLLDIESNPMYKSDYSIKDTCPLFFLAI